MRTLAQTVQDVTGDRVRVAFVHQGDTAHAAGPLDVEASPGHGQGTNERLANGGVARTTPI